jgi:hypothetical protein
MMPGHKPIVYRQSTCLAGTGAPVFKNPFLELKCTPQKGTCHPPGNDWCHPPQPEKHLSIIKKTVATE